MKILFIDKKPRVIIVTYLLSEIVVQEHGNMSFVVLISHALLYIQHEFTISGLP